MRTEVFILIISMRLLALKKCQLFSPSLLLSPAYVHTNSRSPEDELHCSIRYRPLLKQSTR